MVCNMNICRLISSILVEHNIMLYAKPRTSSFTLTIS